jgi:hypothetical protein
VVAEGVETLRQMEVLHRLGCTVMQGFLFSRAVLPDELQRWLEQTVLPRKAPWIGSADDPDEFGGARVPWAAGPIGSGRRHSRPGLPAAPPHCREHPWNPPRHPPTPTALAKGALRRLAQAQLEPTPENYARAYAEESGQPPGRVRPQPWPRQHRRWAAMT